jgi:chorismate mutase
VNLENLRETINQLNAEIIALFSKRMEIVIEVAKVKKEQNLPVDDPVREEEQRALLRTLAKKHGLSPAVIDDIFTLFIDYAKINMKMEMGNESRLPRN